MPAMLSLRRPDVDGEPLAMCLRTGEEEIGLSMAEQSVIERSLALLQALQFRQLPPGIFDPVSLPFETSLNLVDEAHAPYFIPVHAANALFSTFAQRCIYMYTHTLIFKLYIYSAEIKLIIK